MPDSEHAIPSDGGYRDRTGDLLLAKARTPVHQGAPNGTHPRSDDESAAAAATRNRTTPESLSESLRGAGPGAFLRTALTEVGYTRVHTDDRGNESWTHPTIDALPGVLVPADHSRDLFGYETLLNLAAGRLRWINSHLTARAAVDDHWTARERHARALDRSEACHTLRVRHHQAAIGQRHVRTAVSA